MPIFSPQPRFRMYSKASDYTLALWSLLSGSYDAGDYCRNLEHDICKRLHIPSAVSMPQARVALYLAISTIVSPGREVILSPNTIADVINMVICAGSVPVFCDIDPQTGNLDPKQVEALVTEKTAAILVTHLYGLIAPMDKLLGVAKKHDLLVIEDAAQAFGAHINGKYAGTFGDIGVFSFGMAKNITAFFGGMLVSSQEHITQAVRKRLSTYPIISKKKLGNKVVSCLAKDVFSSDLFFPTMLFKIFRYGYQRDIKTITRLIETELDLSLKQEIPYEYKAQLSPLQARLILAKLDQIEADFNHRLECAHIYYDGLKDIEELRLPPMLDDGSNVYNYYPIGYKDRTGLRQYLMRHNRDMALQHIKNTADLPAFLAYYRDCPHCRKWADETVMLPNYAKYRLDEVERNVSVIRSFFGK